MKKFKKKLQSWAAVMELPLSKEMLELFYDYYLILVEWNEKINLTTLINEDDVIEKHFLDSLLPARHKEYLLWDKAVDIGSGGGFPGIPLKIYYPKMELILLDSNAKKTAFLNSAVKKLGLDNIQAVQSRAEESGQDLNFREKYNLVLSRAVAPLNVLCELGLPLCSVGGRAVFYKGSKVWEEIGDAEKALAAVGAELGYVSRETLPISGTTTNLIFLKKTTPTPEKYPRRTGMPSKRPL